jgi:hypothetical protein
MKTTILRIETYWPVLAEGGESRYHTSLFSGLGQLPICCSGGFAGFSRLPAVPGATRNREVL